MEREMTMTEVATSEATTSGAATSGATMSEATMGGAEAGGQRVIEKTLDFDAPIERVWSAITVADELSQWFGREARFEPVVGFEGAMIWPEHGSFALRVEEAEPPTRLVWSWIHKPDVAFDDAPSTRVEWTLSTRDGGGTRLYLRETGFLTDEHFGQNQGGWDEELGELVELLAG